MDYGYIVTQPKAGEILLAAGITQDTKIEQDNPFHYVQGGIEYWIFQAAYWMPPDNERPDGIHFVYSPSADEVNIEDVITPNYTDQGDSLAGWKDTLDQALLIAGLGIGAYVLVNVLGLFKKR